MINRLTDSLKKSAARADEFMTVEAKDKPKLFVDFIDGVKVAAGCSHQLAHSRIDQSPYWLEVRDRLEGIIEIGQRLPTFSQESSFLWKEISKSLTVFSKNIQELFNSKGTPWADVEQMLTQRLKNANITE